MKPAFPYPLLRPSYISWAGHTGMLPASQPLDTIRKSDLRRTEKTLDLPEAFFFLLGSRLRSPLIPLACHKYLCLLSQDPGWTWAGDPGGSQLQCPRSSCLLRAQPRVSPRRRPCLSCVTEQALDWAQQIFTECLLHREHDITDPFRFCPTHQRLLGEL